MSKCDNCRLRKESAKAFDIHWHGEVDCPYDKCPVPNFPTTNADRIRGMTDEELAEYLICDIEAEAIRRAGRYITAVEIDRAIADCLSWLKSPVEDGA